MTVRRRIPLCLASLVVMVLTALTTGGIAAAVPSPTATNTPGPGATNGRGFVVGPLTKAWPPPDPRGQAVPPGVDKAAWQKLQAVWDMRFWTEPENIYKRAYFRAYPNLMGKVVIHHAIEQQVLQKYPGLFTLREIHGVDNLRGIPKGLVNSRMHNSRIRTLWNAFYAQYPPGKATKADFYRWRDRIDLQLSSFFVNQAGSFSAPQAMDRFNAVRAVGEHAFDPTYTPPPATSPPRLHTNFPTRRGRPSGLTNAIASAASAPGGIDFSTLQLRYISDSSTDGKHLVDYAFTAEPETDHYPQGLDEGLTNVRAASTALFVWLALPPGKFWVNLNPNEPDRIIDPAFGRTDPGRVLLEADLELKKTVGRLIHPDTKLGAQFWRGLSGDCFSSRQWIVPAPAVVRQDGDALYILDAPLSVKMETDYIQDHGNGEYRSCPHLAKATEDHNEALYRSLILPGVEKAVNTAPEFAALRQVYLSRVGAEWYRKRNLTKPTSYDKLINSGDINRWASTGSWKPTTTFDKYVDSYTKGEFKVTHKTRRGNYIETRTYTYGGVDLTSVPFQKVATAEFNASWPGLSERVQEGLQDATPDPGTKDIWIGGTSLTAAADDSADGKTTPSAASDPRADGSQCSPFAPGRCAPANLLGAAGLVLILAIAVQAVRSRRGRRTRTFR